MNQFLPQSIFDSLSRVKYRQPVLFTDLEPAGKGLPAPSEGDWSSVSIASTGFLKAAEAMCICLHPLLASERCPDQFKGNFSMEKRIALGGFLKTTEAVGKQPDSNICRFWYLQGFQNGTPSKNAGQL